MKKSVRKVGRSIEEKCSGTAADHWNNITYNGIKILENLVHKILDQIFKKIPAYRLQVSEDMNICEKTK